MIFIVRLHVKARLLIITTIIFQSYYLFYLKMASFAAYENLSHSFLKL